MTSRPLNVQKAIIRGVLVPTVNKVRKEQSPDGTHQHIEGVCTAAGTHYTRKQVVDGIDKGEDWVTSDGNSTAKIKKMTAARLPTVRLHRISQPHQTTLQPTTWTICRLARNRAQDF
jgi:hypothetical protein